MLLQMAGFPSFSWLNNIPVCVHMYVYVLYIYIYMYVCIICVLYMYYIYTYIHMYTCIYIHICIYIIHIHIYNTYTYLTYHIFFVHLSIHGPLGCFYVLAIVTWECRYLFNILFLFPLNTYPEVQLLDHMVVSIFNYFTNLQTVFNSDCTNLCSYPECTRILFS